MTDIKTYEKQKIAELHKETVNASTALADKLMGDLDINADEVVVKSSSENESAEIKSDSGYEGEVDLWNMEELDSEDNALDYDTEVENEVESIADTLHNGQDLCDLDDLADFEGFDYEQISVLHLVSI